MTCSGSIEPAPDGQTRHPADCAGPYASFSLKKAMVLPQASSAASLL